MTSSLALKEDVSNKSNAALGTSTTLFPTQSAVKTYVDAQIASATISDADAVTKGKLQLAGDLAGTAAAPTVPGLALKANTTDVTNSLALKAPINNPTFTGTVAGITQSMVGLANVDNTSDANKPVSSAAQTALNLKAPLASPTFTGTPVLPTGTTAITQSANDNSTKLATTEFVTTSLAAGAPDATTTATGKVQLAGELSGTGTAPTLTNSAVIGKVLTGYSSAAGTVTATDNILQAIQKLNGNDALKAPLASPTFTGTVAGITQSMVGLANVDNTSDVNKPISTLTQTALDLKANLISPTFVTPALGTPTSGVATNLTGLPLTTGVTGTLPVASGGTGATTKSASFDALSPMTTLGDIIYGGASGTGTRLGKGTDGQVLTLTSGVPSWATTSSDVPYTGATGAVNLGAYDLTVNSLTFGRGNNGATYTYNTAIGYQSLQSNVSGNYNTAIGYQTLQSNTDGRSNTAIGRQAMLSNSTGSVNTGVGTLALNNNIDGNYNAAFSNQALYNNTAGSYNTAIGTSSLEENTSGNSNTAIGRVSLYKNTTGEKNTGIGFQAGGDNITGSSNTYLGYNSGLGITGGDNNTIIGANVTGLSSSLTDNIIIANGAGGGSSIKARHDGTSWTLGLIGSGTWSGTAIAVEKGGTGATTASAARTNLGLVIGTDVQAPLVAGTNYLTPTGSAASLTNFPTFNQNTTGNAATATSAGNITATANTTLTSLSNLATVGTITTGVWSGTAVAIEKGGTGLTAAGTNGQVLTSTGSGTLTWTNVSADAGTLTGTTLKSTVTGSSLTSVGILSNATVNGKVIVGASSAASASAVLEASSTTQGFLPPRLNYYQKTQITSPVAGLTIWCSNCGASGEMQVFNGAAWTNMSGGTATGTISLSIGNSYQGGIVAYILVSGDPGYDENTQHGLIAATSDQSTGIPWYNGSYTTTGATGTAIGTGLSNTNTIITSQGATSTSYAAGLARAHTGGGYTDWYLPSKDELAKLYAMKVLGFGGFASNYYWSSTELVNTSAWYQNFYDGIQGSGAKINMLYVRAVRAF